MRAAQRHKRDTLTFALSFESASNLGKTSARTAIFVKDARPFYAPAHNLSYKDPMTELPPVITSSKDLRKACDLLSRQPFVTVDTEFMRQTTYRPKLCLIQMAAPGSEYIADPLAGIDLTPFYALMANETVLKVFHAARQDIEIVYQEAGVIPKPLFDTQVAAMALGHGEAISYGSLVKKILKRNHDKTYQAVDWCARPLNAKQLEYAIGDVTFLRDIYLRLQQRLQETGRESWLEEEVAILIDPKTYAFDPAEAWKRLKLGGKSRQARAIIMELASWRERTAQEENVPRGRVIKDEAIYEVAKHAPRSLETLSRLRTAREVLKSRGEAILRAVETALDRDPSDVAGSGCSCRPARFRFRRRGAPAGSAQGRVGGIECCAETARDLRGPGETRPVRGAGRPRAQGLAPTALRGEGARLAIGQTRARDQEQGSGRISAIGGQ